MIIKSPAPPKLPLLQESTAIAIIDRILKMNDGFSYSDLCQLQNFAEASWRHLYYKFADYALDADRDHFIDLFRDLPNHPHFMVDLAGFLGLTPDQFESMVAYIEREENDGSDSE